jgi:hypothetical protein
MRKIKTIVEAAKTLSDEIEYQLRLASNDKSGMKQLEKKYGKKLSNYQEWFDQMMIPGKLSALNWVLGKPWGCLTGPKDESIKLRSNEEMGDAATEFCEKVWYFRCHLVMKDEIKDGELHVVKHIPEDLDSEGFIEEGHWKSCLTAGKKVVDKYGKENLVLRSDFEWAVINGKLSALRWVMGLDWDELFT